MFVALAVTLGIPALICLGAAGIDLWPFDGPDVIVDERRPVAVLDIDADPLTVDVVVHWEQSGWCPGGWEVSATETATEVRVSTVTTRDYPGGECAGLGTSNGLAWAYLSFRAHPGTGCSSGTPTVCGCRCTPTG